MTLVVCSGMYSTFQVQALQFEWAWQHPEKSKAVRDDVAALVASCKRAGLSGAKGKVGGQLSQLMRHVYEVAEQPHEASQKVAHVSADSIALQTVQRASAVHADFRMCSHLRARTCLLSPPAHCS